MRAAPDLFASSRRCAARGQTDRPLTINWVVRAPIAGTGGGYWTIFRLANALAAAGHHVRVYVEPIAHLAGLSYDEILAFVERDLRAAARRGRRRSRPHPAGRRLDRDQLADRLHRRAARGSLFKFYFVAGLRAEFYEESDPLYRRAAGDLRPAAAQIAHRPLAGASASERPWRTGRTWIDFAVDPACST